MLPPSHNCCQLQVYIKLNNLQQTKALIIIFTFIAWCFIWVIGCAVACNSLFKDIDNEAVHLVGVRTLRTCYFFLQLRRVGWQLPLLLPSAWPKPVVKERVWENRGRLLFLQQACSPSWHSCRGYRSNYAFWHFAQPVSPRYLAFRRKILCKTAKTLTCFFLRIFGGFISLTFQALSGFEDEDTLISNCTHLSWRTLPREFVSKACDYFLFCFVFLLPHLFTTNVRYGFLQHSHLKKTCVNYKWAEFRSAWKL